MQTVPWSLSRKTLIDLLEIARQTFPNEFISLLSVTEENPFVISEIVVVPAEFGRNHSFLRRDLVPFDPFIVGSVHSHPSSSMKPSRADKVAFSRLGKVHLILGYPYLERDFRAFDKNANPVSITVVGNW
jgi:proteasome lid subunit RPN8/RPN11